MAGEVNMKKPLHLRRLDMYQEIIPLKSLKFG